VDFVNGYMTFIVRLAVILFVITLFSCVRDIKKPVNKTIVCDAESLTKTGDKFVAVNDSSELFNGGKFRSNLASHSGDYSVLTIPKTHPYAFGHKITDAAPDSYFRISVWRKSKDGMGVLAFASTKNDTLYLVTSKPVEVNEGGWEKLEIETYTPPFLFNSILKIFVWNNGTDTVYFDDLIIERKPQKQYPDYEYYKGLSIVLDTSEYVKISNKRKQAFENGILQTSGNDWVKGIVVDYDKAMKAKVRLKGDWLDHLMGDKWSYRVKMKKKNTFNQLRTFSLQTPAARGYLMEWVTHSLYHENDILTTRYGFVPFMFNDEPRGIYAWEEHFVKQLPEWNSRREGPIVKFTEDPFWQVQKIGKDLKKWPGLPYYQTATIVPFGQSRTVRNSALFKQFMNAQKLMYQYKTQQKLPSEIFDINRLAKYYAILELTHARHGMTWHNQRMYYNPVLCKLEPIAYDGYTEHVNIDFSINDNMAYRTFVENTNVFLIDYLMFNLFTDSVFVSKYMYYLKKYSSQNFIKGFMDKIYAEATVYDSLLRLEFPYYYYDDSLLFKSADSIRMYLPELQNIINEKLKDSDFEISLRKEEYPKNDIYENTPEFFVNVYTEKLVNDKKIVSIYNYFPDSLIFLGTGDGKKLITDYFVDPPGILPYVEGMKGQYLELTVDSSANNLFFLVHGSKDTYSVPILQWPYPEGITPQQELWAKIDLSNPFFEKVSGKDIFVTKGNITVDQPIIIPDGYNVHFLPDTKIDLINNAMIISYSPVTMIGTKEEPIIITSSDFTGNGFTVLQAAEKSKLNNVIFEKLNTLNYNSWTLTGAVTFYESTVSITNTKFYRNQCEDALNIVRSGFL